MSDNADNATGEQTPQPIMNEKGEFSENWHEPYGKDKAPTLSRYKRFDDLVNSHMELRSKLGKDPDSLVAIPAEDDADGWKALNRRLGAPEDVSGYEYRLDPEIEKVVGEADSEQMEAFKNFALENGLKPKTFKNVMDYYFKMNAEGIQKFATINEAQEQQAHEEAVKTLKGEWGAAYDEKTARAQLLINKYGGNELVTRENLHNDVGFIKLMDNIANDMAEDRIKGLSHASAPTPGQVDNKIAELQKTEAYNNRAHPDHRRVNEQVTELYKQRNK